MKLIISDASLLRSKQPMAEMLYGLQTQAEETLNLGQFWRTGESSPSARGEEQLDAYMEGLLQPPGICRVDVEDYVGPGRPIVFVSTAADAGAIRLVVSIRDEAGEPVECSEAMQIPGTGTEWGCAVLEPVPSGTLLHVSVKAIDCVGGVRVAHRRLVVP